ncbi:MAG: sulfoxide reductase heme-binding subunit YedZ, partial [Chloroflexi bacterium RBG_16_48_8]
MKWFRCHWLLLLTHIGSIIPMVILVWDWSQGNLTANPIQSATLRTGRFAMILLILSLAITPLNFLFGLRQLMPLRKWLGLYSAFYVGVHLLIFIGIDYGFNVSLVQADLLSKRYVIVGFLAGLILLPLALTSTKGWQRRLKKNWKRLHRFVYLAGMLAATHFIWLVKSDIRTPLLYAGVVSLLLVLRIPVIRRHTSGLR